MVCVPELVHHNVLELTELSELVVGIDAPPEVHVVTAQLASDVETEFASVIQVVRTNTADLMVVVENVEPVWETKLSAKATLMPSLNNVPFDVPLNC
jgi:hypothetical protein